ncbi:DUF6123 family protein [Bacillus benzoevorans]|uniref:Uncharacterized protein n=1 Tax=Bacillus benzoevorans TaxID=1456 RepID=A0A7X0HQ18_9BACI|nr:DUF6123 family protein [Bacillus benzoevorans]MBB6444631.1 hypothetical protein [Bacillus benzoevorans]
MKITLKTVGQYVDFLKEKGFMLKDDAIGFISFGKQTTNATDEITITAIELTLKTQKEFDGSYFISLLETLVKGKVKNRGAAIRFVKERELIAI